VGGAGPDERKWSGFFGGGSEASAPAPPDPFFFSLLSLSPLPTLTVTVLFVQGQHPVHPALVLGEAAAFRGAH
jgi:hypothetical protein